MGADMGRMLVTGGAGFIGSHVVDALVAAGRTVRVADNLSTGARENLAAHADTIELCEGDLEDEAFVQKVCADVEVVIHLAALSGVPFSVEQPVATARAGILATVQVLAAAQAAGARRVVCASSSSAYGGEGPFPQCEDRPPQPKSPYAASKVSGEVYARTFAQCYGLDTVSLRFFNVFGPRQPLKSRYAAVFPAFITRMLAGKAPEVFGDGTQARDFTYVANAAQACLLAANEPAALQGTVLNVAAGQTTSLLELIEKLNALMGTKLQPEHKPGRPGDVQQSWADISRAQKLIGYRPVATLDAGLAATVDYYRGSNA